MAMGYRPSLSLRPAGPGVGAAASFGTSDVKRSMMLLGVEKFIILLH